MTLLCALALLPVVAGAQTSGTEARKPHLRCAAVLGWVATATKEQKSKDAHTSMSMLLTVWASELDPSVPSKEALDITTREFGAEVQQVAAEVRKGTESDAARQEFRQAYTQEIARCRAFFSELAKTKPR
jgi:thioesterase domain-containing protein